MESMLNKNVIEKILAVLQRFGCESIIVGGSAVDEETAIYRHNHNKYWLSDIDLLCVRTVPFSAGEVFEINNAMLELSRSISQHNPYFHIGLKLRGTQELYGETDSLYFRQLSESSLTLSGHEFAELFPYDQKFGFFNCRKNENESSEVMTKILVNMITRLWCNVLFFPAMLFLREKDEFRIWYNYFFSRGALDLQIWDLALLGQWVGGYENRASVWANLEGNKGRYNPVMRDCLYTKLGKENVDFCRVMNPVLELTQSRAEMLLENEIGLKNCSEFRFVLFMNKVISALCVDRDPPMAHASLEKAQGAFHEFFPSAGTSWGNCVIETWVSLRQRYSDFRFARNVRDLMDHKVYTEYFLKLGLPTGRDYMSLN